MLAEETVRDVHDSERVDAHEVAVRREMVDRAERDVVDHQVQYHARLALIARRVGVAVD